MAKKKLSDKQIDAKNQKILTICLGFLALLAVMAGVIWAYTTSVKNSRQLDTEEGITAMTYSDFSKAEQLLARADQEGETYASEFLAWLEISGGHYDRAYYYAKRATELGRLATHEILGDLALLNIGDAKGSAAAIAYFERGAILLANDQARRIRENEFYSKNGQARRNYAKALSQSPDGSISNANIREVGTELFSQMVLRALPIIQKEDIYVDFLMRAINKKAKYLDMQMGDLMFYGSSKTASNAEVAIQYWQNAMDQGLDAAYVRIAGAYWHGYARENRDPQTAIELYTAAADKEDPVALYSLGLICLRNSGINPAMAQQAITYFSRASAKGYGPASTALGILALTETTTDLSLMRAVEWLKLASSNQNDISGRVIYDLLLLTGNGVQKNFNVGFDDLVILSKDFVPASAIVDLLRERIDPQEIFKQVVTLSNQVLRGQIAYREGDPVAKQEIFDPVEQTFIERPFTFYKSVNTIDQGTIARFGRENFCPVTDFTNFTVNGTPILSPELAKVIQMYNPSTGVSGFKPQNQMPRPNPPLVPNHYNIGDFVPPVVLLEKTSYFNETNNPRTIF